MLRTKKTGFTLLELLIVVIIVSILAAVALPRFAKMTRRARAAEGLSGVGAILTAQEIYYQERTSFANTTADILVDFNTVNFTYTVVSASSTQSVVRASGVASTPVAGMSITGTVNNDGSKSVAVTVN